MTSIRQIEANRRNAIRSTGPKTEDGKTRSRRNAIRHGLSAETVIEIAEDLEDYRGFEASVIADYDPITAVERELVLRLASLLWRLRRASSIETDLFRIQAELLHERRPLQTIEQPPVDAEGNAERWPEQLEDPGLEHCGSSLVNPIRDLTHAFNAKTITTMAPSSGWGGMKPHSGAR